MDSEKIFEKRGHSVFRFSSWGRIWAVPDEVAAVLYLNQESFTGYFLVFHTLFSHFSSSINRPNEGKR